MSTFPTLAELALMWPFWIAAAICGLIYIYACYLDYWEEQKWIKIQRTNERRKRIERLMASRN